MRPACRDNAEQGDTGFEILIKTGLIKSGVAALMPALTPHCILFLLDAFKFVDYFAIT